MIRAMSSRNDEYRLQMFLSAEFTTEIANPLWRADGSPSLAVEPLSSSFIMGTGTAYQLCWKHECYGLK